MSMCGQGGRRWEGWEAIAALSFPFEIYLEGSQQCVIHEARLQWKRAGR